ncbi:HypC/HybG/HupF family hydrogenase formation chaperone [Mangrovimicrobium sediminis]|uniref:HypC/HybG/HupF family hydrogenase formation chaperone n=1 Tax=Mangrovimicrobium sediminis TaxID=2562682 RepID=A0A4Z0M3S3_9GAMM|nr:HypC/HybG/HupF family hydrogenase formation chaperone [Haliea sp. SAOS-164]TGD74333.1 HypC/HybG/HupF family hydrogenase formation chaperone [Haliea sp. SAOS-164]
MCLAIPGEILSIDSDADTAVVAVGEVSKSVSLALVGEVAVGDYVLVHVGYALERLDPAEAEKTLALFAEMGGQAEAAP